MLNRKWKNLKIQKTQKFQRAEINSKFSKLNGKIFKLQKFLILKLQLQKNKKKKISKSKNYVILNFQK